MTYQYKNVRLTPKIVAEIAHDLFQGKIVKRMQIMPAVRAKHLDNGGYPPEAANETATLKKAIRRLVDEGRVQNIGYGQYEFYSAEESRQSHLETEPEVLSASREVEFQVEKWEGKGSEIVYAYCYPAYRDQAKLARSTYWPVKIGMSAVGLSRIMEQAGTALPEHPIILLAIRTSNGRSLERAIHSCLTAAGRRKEASPGTEWFETNPEEILQIYQFVEGMKS